MPARQIPRGHGARGVDKVLALPEIAACTSPASSGATIAATTPKIEEEHLGLPIAAAPPAVEGDAHEHVGEDADSHHETEHEQRRPDVVIADVRRARGRAPPRAPDRS